MALRHFAAYDLSSPGCSKKPATSSGSFQRSPSEATQRRGETKDADIIGEKAGARICLDQLLDLDSALSLFVHALACMQRTAWTV